MTTHINDTGLSCFNKLASRSASRDWQKDGDWQAKAPLTLEALDQRQSMLSEHILTLQTNFYPDDIPQRCMALTFEDSPPVFDDDHDDDTVVVTSVLDEMTALDAELAIAHIVDTLRDRGAPISHKARVNSADLNGYMDWMCISYAMAGAAAGFTGLLLSQLLILTL